MKFDTLDVCLNACFNCYGIKRITFFNYKDLFFIGDLRVMNENSGLKKSRSNTIEIVVSINKIVDQNL